MNIDFQLVISDNYEHPISDYEDVDFNGSIKDAEEVVRQNVKQWLLEEYNADNFMMGIVDTYIDIKIPQEEWDEGVRRFGKTPDPTDVWIEAVKQSRLKREQTK